MKENKPSVEERLDFFENVLNKVAEQQVFIEEALKLMKKKIEAMSIPDAEEQYCKDIGGFSANEEV